jgi:hypothetical protein
MRRMAVAGAIVALACLGAAPAAADTIKVENTTDSGAGSLRQALDDAFEGDTIKVPKGHYELTSGQLEVDTRVSIKGAGARKTVVDANRNSRVFEVADGLGPVRFSGLTIREGDTDAAGDGGGIESGPGTDLRLTEVAVLNNHVITNADFRNGGGVYSIGPVVIKRSLFAGNHAYNGGAVLSFTGAKAIDSTFYNNVAGNPTWNGEGGAFDEPVSLIDSTVVGNQCFNGDGCGGGLDGPGLTLKGTIVAGNIAYQANGEPAGSPGNPGVANNCGVSPLSNGHNLSDRSDCDLAGPGDIEGKNPKLGKLKNNGGPTNTLALGRKSPAFNAGAKKCTAHDQRGVRRPQGKRCDIGAYERD